jgi:spore photoproduct lyase
VIKYQQTKTIDCKPNSRSSHITSGNFILGCRSSNNNYAHCAYCYVERWNRKAVYVNTNIDDILESCNQWVLDKQFPPIPSQVGNDFYYVDIACDTDLLKYSNIFNWKYVFDYFKEHPKLAATLATKFVNTKILDYNADKKVRIRVSLLPEYLRTKVERGTSPINKRIEFITKLLDAGYQCHINLSPIIVYEGKNWRQDYINLFRQIRTLPDSALKELSLECIFLTHHAGMHLRNIEKFNVSEDYLWKPELQENKVSQYGGNNLRYKWQIKNKMIEVFKQMVDEYLGLEIRYIF